MNINHVENTLRDELLGVLASHLHSKTRNTITTILKADNVPLEEALQVAKRYQARIKLTVTVEEVGNASE